MASTTTAIDERLRTGDAGVAAQRDVDFRPEVATLRRAATLPGVTAVVRGPRASCAEVIDWAIDTIRPEPVLLSAHVWRSQLRGDAQPWLQVATQVEAALAERGEPIALGSLARADAPDIFVQRLVAALDDLRMRTDRPIVVTVEGLHDADQASVELTSAMAERLTSASLVVAIRNDVPVGRRVGTAIDEVTSTAVCIDIDDDWGPSITDGVGAGLAADTANRGRQGLDHRHTEPSHAIDLLTSSGDAHLEAAAPDAAESAWSKALGLCTRFGVAAEQKLAVLLRLTHLVRRLGRPAGDDLARELLSVARCVGDPLAVGRAALASMRFPLPVAALIGGDPSASFPIADALRMVDSGNPELRCRLLCAAVANESGTAAQRTRMLSEAEELARAAPAGDRPELHAQVALAAALLDHGPVRLDPARLELAAALPPDSEARLALLLIDALHNLRAGELTTACERLDELVETDGTRPIEWAATRMLAAAFAQLGRHDEAGRWAKRSSEAGRGTVLGTRVDNDERLRRSSSATPSDLSHPESSPPCEVGLGRLPFLPWHAQRAADQAERDPRFARAVVSTVFDVALEELAATPHHLPTMAFAGRAAARIGDHTSCERAIEMLLPFADELLVVGRGGLVDGPIAEIVADAATAIGADELADQMRVRANVVKRRAGLIVEDTTDHIAAAAPAEPASLTRRGRGWTLTHAGTSVELPDLKGLAFIARLMAVPDRELPVRLLEEPEPLDRLEHGRTELLNLQDEIHEADEFNDTARLEVLQDRFDALVSELATTHHFVDDIDPAEAERTRVRVTKSVRAALDRIASLHPSAGAQLQAAVHTGKTCRFAGSAVLWVTDSTAPAT